MDEMNRDEKIALLKDSYADKDKFAPKLTFEQRCQILALHRIGIVGDHLAKMFKVNRRTITHIYNPNSPHYRDVREKERSIGETAFREKYLPDDAIDAALAQRQLANEEQASINMKWARQKEGIHVVRGKECKYEHRITIAWREPDENVQVAGWYYRDLDSDFPDVWLFVDEESLKTSSKCYVAMLHNIFDKIS